MTDEEFKDFAKAIGTVGIAFNRELDEPTIDLYFRALRDIPWPLVRQATAHAIRFEERWPNPARWRRIIDQVVKENPNLALMPRPEQRLLTGAVQDQDGEWTTVYCCHFCQDTGWRPDCGCPAVNILTAQTAEHISQMGTCGTHGAREAHGLEYRRAMMRCHCIDSNPAYLARHPRPTPRYSRWKED